jgi:hypothetical protein
VQEYAVNKVGARKVQAGFVDGGRAVVQQVVGFFAKKRYKVLCRHERYFSVMRIRFFSAIGKNRRPNQSSKSE